jgi:hypothetical protein
MALFHSPNIVTNGLEFYYDMSNTQKSWRGAPTTNLCSFNIASSGFNTDTPGNLSQTANITTVTYEGRPSRRMNILAAGYCNYYISNYNTGVSSGVFTASCKIKVADGSNPNAFINAGYIYGTAGTFVPGATFTALADGWYLVSWLYSGSSMALNSLTGLTGTASKAITFYITDYQVEALNVPTPFVTGTRGSTQALLDLTNKYTLTPTNVIYNSNGTFSFNNSWFDLNSNNIITGNNPFTVESWYTTTGTTSDEIFGNYGSASTSGTLWISGRYGTYINGSVYFPGAPLGAGTYLLSTTRDTSGNVILYRNGVQVSSGVLASSIPVTYNFRIGADVNGGAEPFTGSIHSVKVYNRVLTAAEVAQNFDAHRGRYGL